MFSGHSEVSHPPAKEQEMVGLFELYFEEVSLRNQPTELILLVFFVCPSTIQGTLPKSRHFLFVDDAIDAFLLLLENGVVGEIYNVGTSCEIPIVHLARELVKMVGAVLLNQTRVGKSRKGSGKLSAFVLSGQERAGLRGERLARVCR